KLEVKTLMNLLVTSLKKELPTMQENNIRLNAIGCLDNLPPSTLSQLQGVIDKTAHNKGMNLILALSYGSREEIVAATKKICQSVKKGQLNIEDLDEDLFQRHLYTNYLPDIDLMIRTSGE